MLIRIVKMEFREEKIEEFLQFFQQAKTKIRSSDGCKRLELWQDKDCPSRVFTYSWWEKEGDLDIYRQSPFFRKSWSTVKQWFKEPPVAWSVASLEVLA